MQGFGLPNHDVSGYNDFNNNSFIEIPQAILSIMNPIQKDIMQKIYAEAWAKVVHEDFMVQAYKVRVDLLPKYLRN